MTRIIIDAISADKARLRCYRELLSGDWWVDPGNGDIHITVVAADVWDQEDAFLVALHELCEARLCFKAGIVQGAVDEADMLFMGDGEPGDAPDAPYRVQHRQAMLLEHMMAVFLGKYDYGKVE